MKLSYSNGQCWLIGSNETIADWSLWPFVRQYRLINPKKFELEEDLYYLKMWLNFFLEHKLYDQLMMKIEYWSKTDKDIILNA